MKNERVHSRRCLWEPGRRSRPTKRKSSRFIGVSYDRKRRKWLAYIKKSTRQKNLGLYNTELEAAKARDTAARTLHGDFAVINFE